MASVGYLFDLLLYRANWSFLCGKRIQNDTLCASLRPNDVIAIASRIDEKHGVGVELFPLLWDVKSLLSLPHRTRLRLTTISARIAFRAALLSPLIWRALAPGSAVASIVSQPLAYPGILLLRRNLRVGAAKQMPATESTVRTVVSENKVDFMLME